MWNPSSPTAGVCGAPGGVSVADAMKGRVACLTHSGAAEKASQTAGFAHPRYNTGVNKVARVGAARNQHAHQLQGVGAESHRGGGGSGMLLRSVARARACPSRLPRRGDPQDPTPRPHRFARRSGVCGMQAGEALGLPPGQTKLVWRSQTLEDDAAVVELDDGGAPPWGAGVSSPVRPPPVSLIT